MICYILGCYSARRKISNNATRKMKTVLCDRDRERTLHKIRFHRNPRTKKVNDVCLCRSKQRGQTIELCTMYKFIATLRPFHILHSKFVLTRTTLASSKVSFILVENNKEYFLNEEIRVHYQ